MKDILEQVRLDPDAIVDIDLDGEYLRNHALRGICAEWGRRRPIYVINHGMAHVVATRHADVRTVYIDGERFTAKIPEGPGYERLDFFNGVSNVSSSEGPDHDRVRRAFLPHFGPAGIKRVQARVDAIIDDMLDEVEALGGPFDCLHDFAFDLVGRVILDSLLGMSKQEQAAFRRLQLAFGLVVDLAPGEERPAEFMDAFNAVLATIDAMVEDRRRRPREDDFVSTLVERMDTTDMLSMDELVGNTLSILSAGQGTTSIATTAMLTNLCKHRDQFDQVIADPSLIPQTVEECLRYQGPGLFSFARYATRDTDLGGTKIFKDMPVLISQQSANYDPQKYPDPLRFDIHRKPTDVMTFGTGSHHCLGNRLARLIMRLVLQKVCARFPSLHLPQPDFEPDYEGMFGELRMTAAPMHTGN